VLIHGQGLPHLSRRYDAVGGFTIHARESARRPAPERPPIVLVHGLLVSSRYMVPLAQRLAAWYPVFVPDLPGWGHSSKPRRAFSVPELADVLVAWLDTIGVERAVLVANSFGCQVVADVAARYPDRVSLMVLLGPTVDPEVRSLWRIVGRWLLDVPLEPYRLGLLIARDLLDMGLRRLIENIRVMLADHIEQKLPAIGVPTLVVRGQRDPTVTARWAAGAARLSASGRMVEIPGAPHAINYNADAAVAALVHAFVEAWCPPSNMPVLPRLDCADAG
jgi:2-hydroxy-6-oxonona-2,4-dienedioate hydrolase